MKNFIFNKSLLLIFCFALAAAPAAAQNSTELPAPTAAEPGATTTPAEQPETALSQPEVAKKEGKIRVGLAGVKTGKIGKEMNPYELAAAVQNTLGAYLKGTKLELVPIEAKLPEAIDAEAREKQCDFVLYATVSHKKGGGGFGAFAKVAPILMTAVPMVGIAGGMGGMIAGSVASTAIGTAAGATSNVKKKDEIILELKLQNGPTVAFTKQYKAKAKNAGEDIISPMIEQAAQELINAVAK